MQSSFQLSFTSVQKKSMTRSYYPGRFHDEYFCARSGLLGKPYYLLNRGPPSIIPLTALVRKVAPARRDDMLPSSGAPIRRVPILQKSSRY
ncbi:hypothetical protein GcC1_062001 [Golovinomyces cichoracearum]|uniref:Uncharacterized protein n=1 Tax=Golovinomyces cichoracearum TaxID=62708 RepID=A0A420ISV7_9PEZI|nr:hypothetical protein GcC1_062001 [Golovinomyces cichoracearum]